MARIPVCTCLLLTVAFTVFARGTPQDLVGRDPGCAPGHRGMSADAAALPSRVPTESGRADTLSFGYFTTIGGVNYAVPGETWTWDHGSDDPFEGWWARDLTESSAFFRQITAADWGGHGDLVSAPIGDGAGSVWCGRFQDGADSLCWGGGLGYGNRWCQRLVSPPIHYAGSGDVTLSFLYFNDSEATFDYTKIYLHVSPSEPEVLNPPGFNGRIGVQAGASPPPPQFATYTRVLAESELGGAGAPRDVTLYLQFRSDPAYSDEDGSYATAYGPFGMDDVSLRNNLAGGDVQYDFESGLQGWTPEVCPVIGSFFSVQSLSGYMILDPCGCRLSGQVAAFHDQSWQHPTGQHVAAYSPIVRKSIEAPYPAWNGIMAEWDQYDELPQANGVRYRSGWEYYPYLCPSTGATRWSGRQGTEQLTFSGDAPLCSSRVDIAGDHGIPADCEAVRFVYEVVSSCDEFGVSPCSGTTNFTPIIDNLRIRMFHRPVAPVVNFSFGAQFRDGFSNSGNLDVMATGDANSAVNLHAASVDLPALLGDSLVVVGPAPTVSTKFLTRLWFRVRREGPAQVNIARYRSWKAKVSDGINIVGETAPNKGRNFAFGWMDSTEAGTAASKQRFCSQFHEMDDDFTPPEQGEDNEIIWDDMLTPGTKIEYFVTANYICTPNENFYLPDTTGQNCLEFEILPSYRNLPNGTYRFPCVLWVNAAGDALVPTVEHALNVVLNGASPTDPIPNPTTWDRLDYLFSCSCTSAGIFRETGGNAGGTAAQYLGYRMILFDAGSLGAGSTFATDWDGFADWLSTNDCSSGQQDRQGFWVGGANIGEILTETGHGQPQFLSSYLGASLDCRDYAAAQCPTSETEDDNAFCVRLDPAAGGPWMPDTDLDLAGSGYPDCLGFDVFTPLEIGIGNKKFQKVSDGYEAPGRYAQIAHDASGEAANYRTLISAYSLGHLTTRAPGHLGDGSLECGYDPTRAILAGADEIRHTLLWTLGLTDLSTLRDLRLEPCAEVGSLGSPTAGGAHVNRLYQNSPNPFGPRTAIRFSLASKGPARITIYDVSGRKVRMLVDEVKEAGLHEVAWDGADDLGHPLPAGIYWSQLTAGSFSSSRKMVVLK